MKSQGTKKRGYQPASSFLKLKSLIYFLTIITTALKASGLFIARSARVLRLISMLFLCINPMNTEYDRPNWRTPALIRTIQRFLTVSYTHLRAHETGRNLVCRLLLEKKKK